MDIFKNLTLGLIILTLISCHNKKEEKSNDKELITPEQNNKKLDLVRSTWTSIGVYGLDGDSLIFESNKKVRLYLGELSWGFDSDYIISNDTLTVKTITATFEMNDVSSLKPDLIQKFIISKDSLQLFYLANKIKNRWEKADINRIKRITNYYKIK